MDGTKVQLQNMAEKWECQLGASSGSGGVGEQGAYWHQAAEGMEVPTNAHNSTFKLHKMRTIGT